MRNNIEEIHSDPSLTFYGAALAVAYFVTSVFMFRGDHYASLLSPSVEPICWPWFESCYHYRFLSNSGIRASVLVFGATSVVPLIAFLRKKVSLGYYSLLLVACLHLLMFAQDFRNTQNQYYMLFWVVLTYLFLPGKRSLLHYLILSFYFWAGRLKLNMQWLSGQGLYQRLWFIPPSLNSAACIYVVFLEMVMIWGLVSKKTIWFWATLFQLMVFHIISASQVGFYYPALMFVILSIYPVNRLLNARAGNPLLQMSRFNWAVFGFFAFLQIYPSIISRDRALEGVGRTFALNMFEGIFDCEVNWSEHYKDGHTSKKTVKDKETERLECEPIYYYSKTLNHCRQLKTDPRFVDLDFEMTIKRLGDSSMTEIIHQNSFCSDPPSFNLFFPNSWISVKPTQREHPEPAKP